MVQILKIVTLFVALKFCLCYDNHDSTSALGKAIRQLLERHGMVPFNPQEEKLPTRQESVHGFPDRHIYGLPNAIVWEPHTQLSQYLPSELLCPRCGDQGNVCHLTPRGWKDGRTPRHVPRKIYGLSGTVLVISREYGCKAGHEIIGHDSAILETIKNGERIPFLLTHKSGMTRELVEVVVAMVRNGLSFVQIHDVLAERLHLLHVRSQKRFLEDVQIYSARHPIVFDISFPDLGYQTNCPSRNIITDFFLHYFNMNEELFTKRMSAVTCKEGWLSCDHTFDIAGNIGYERKQDGKWVRQYDSLFCVLNDKGQIATWQLTKTQGFEDVRLLLERLSQRLIAQGVTVNEFYIDNCCHWRKKLQEIFGQTLHVKLDLFHAFQRISSKISKRHSLYWRCLQDLRLLFRDPTDLGETRVKNTPGSEVLIKNAEMFLKKWQSVKDVSGSQVLSEQAVKEVKKLMEHMRKGCLSGIAAGRGTNRNEALHRWINRLFSASKVGARLAYALLMIIFDKINHKDDSKNIPEEKSVEDLKNEILTGEDSRKRSTQNMENLIETFGIKTGVLLPSASEDGKGTSQDLITAADANEILTKVENTIKILKSLLGTSRSTTISYRQFPLLNQAMTLFNVSEECNEQICDEHDERIDNVLKSWSMKRELVPKDGDCCFRAVARNICTLRNGEIKHEMQDHLAKLGILDLNEDEMTAELRELTVMEWLGERRQDYEKFVSKDDFEDEARRFRQRGYFAGDMGNLMPLGMSNVLRMSIVIFSSLENYPIIPILPTNLIFCTPQLFLAFNSSASGHYDFVTFVSGEPTVETAKHKLLLREEKSLSCSCGVNRKDLSKNQNICNNVLGTYSSRCKCLQGGSSCGYNCRCKGCCNPHGKRPEVNTTEGAPRKRRKFSFQEVAYQNSSEFLTSRGEELRESSMTDAEYLVFEEIISREETADYKNISIDQLLESYNFIQSLCATRDKQQFQLRRKTKDDIKKAVAAHKHETEVMATLLKRQIEMSELPQKPSEI